MTTTIQFAEFPFVHKGVLFISRVSEDSRYLPQILKMGEAFIEMNKQAVDECLDITPTTTHQELVAMVDFINENGSEMFLELAGNQ